MSNAADIGDRSTPGEASRTSDGRDPQGPRLAAILYVPSQGPFVDTLLTGLTEKLRREGRSLAGAIQWNTVAGAGPCNDMVLEDLASRKRVMVSEDRGPMAKGCRLDSSALEEMAGLTLASIAPGVELVIVNKFSKSEAEGAGLRQVIEAAVLAGIPVLVGLNATHRAAWEAFSGGDTDWLPPEQTPIEAWCQKALADEAIPL